MTQPYKTTLSRLALEPEAHNAIDANGGVMTPEAMMLSQTISLKRIADKIEALGDQVASAGGINTLFWALGQDFGRGFRS